MAEIFRSRSPSSVSKTAEMRQFSGDLQRSWYQPHTKVRNPGDPGDFQIQQGLPECSKAFTSDERRGIDRSVMHLA